MKKLSFLLLLHFTASANVPVVWEKGAKAEADMTVVREGYVVQRVSIGEDMLDHADTNTTVSARNELYTLRSRVHMTVREDQAGEYIFPTAPSCVYQGDGTAPARDMYRYIEFPGGYEIAHTFPAHVTLNKGTGTMEIESYYPAGSIAGDNARIECTMDGYRRGDPDQRLRVYFYSAVITAKPAVARVEPPTRTVNAKRNGVFSTNFTIYSSTYDLMRLPIRVHGSGSNVTSVALNGVTSDAGVWEVALPPLQHLDRESSSANIELRGVVPNPGPGNYRLNFIWSLP